jgi:hypothetical protein
MFFFISDQGTKDSQSIGFSSIIEPEKSILAAKDAPFF